MPKGQNAFIVSGSRSPPKGRLGTWDLTDGYSVRYECRLSGSTRADYVPCDRHGWPMAVIEAKRSALNPADAAAQGQAYAKQLDVPFTFLSNGKEIRFWDFKTEAHPRSVKTFFKQHDLEQRIAVRRLRVEPLTVPVDGHGQPAE